MTEEKKPEEQEQPHDLDANRTEEHDNLQKSEHPDGQYMNDRSLCQTCHGVKRVCDRSDCPQKGMV